MDNMQHYEAEMLLDNMMYANKDEWERTRMLMYTSLSPYLKKKDMSPQELFPLVTDDNCIEVYEEPKPTKDDFERMKAMAQEFERKINSKKNEEQIKLNT